MDHPGGCLCGACCDAARDFAFGHWGLDRPVATPFGMEDALVSREGRWEIDSGEHDPLEVFDKDGYLYAERRAA